MWQQYAIANRSSRKWETDEIVEPSFFFYMVKRSHNWKMPPKNQVSKKGVDGVVGF